MISEYKSKTTYNNYMYSTSDCTGEPVPSQGTLIDTCTVSDDDSKEYLIEENANDPLYMDYNVLSYASKDDCKSQTISKLNNVKAYTSLYTDCINTGSDVSLKVDSCTGSSVSLTVYAAVDCGGIGVTSSFDSCSSLNPLGEGVRYDCPEDHSGSCFSKTETVQLENGSIKQISDVEVGDRIMSADIDGTISFSSVVAVAHPTNSKITSFLHIETSTTDIKATPDHLLLASIDCVSDMKLTKAADIVIDSCIATTDGPVHVEAISEEVHAGIYSVVTEKEYIVVNGVIASPFAVNHHVASLYYDFHRTVFAFAPAVLMSSLFKSLHFGISAISLRWV